MAEHVHTMAAPDVVRLQGSSSPTGEVPAFRPVATTAGALQSGKTMHPSRLFLASDEAEMTALSTRLVALIKLEDRLSLRLSGRSLQQPLSPKDLRCDRIQGRTVGRIGRELARLTRMTAPSRTAMASKANVMLELKLAGWDPPIRDDLGVSLTRDVLNLALADACQAAEHVQGLSTREATDQARVA